MNDAAAAVVHIVDGVDQTPAVYRVAIRREAIGVARRRDDLVEIFATTIARAVNLPDGRTVKADLKARGAAASDHVEEAQIARHGGQVRGFDRLPPRHAVVSQVLRPEFDQPA